MSVVRAILLALIALSLALPPVAGAKAFAYSPHGSSVAAQPDCCEKMEHCDKQAKGDCADFAGCALKCSNATAVVLMPSAILLRSSPALKLTLTPDTASSRSLIPPAPPPRV
jgi:hypothetical protein